jgi:hypothetical protein
MTKFLGVLMYLVMAFAAAAIRASVEPQLSEWENVRGIRSRERLWTERGDGWVMTGNETTQSWPGILFGYALFWWYALPALAIYWMGMRRHERALARFSEVKETERAVKQLEEGL